MAVSSWKNSQGTADADVQAEKDQAKDRGVGVIHGLSALYIFFYEEHVYHENNGTQLSLIICSFFAVIIAIREQRRPHHLLPIA